MRDTQVTARKIQLAALLASDLLPFGKQVPERERDHDQHRTNSAPATTRLARPIVWNHVQAHPDSILPVAAG